MSKFKFGDKVWHDEFELGIILYKDETCDNEYFVYFERDDYHTTMKDCELTKVSDWIPCSERMPEFNVRVLVVSGNRFSYDFLLNMETHSEWASLETWEYWNYAPDMPEVKEIMNEWISISNKMPKLYEQVLTRTESLDYEVCYLRNDGLFYKTNGDLYDFVSDWKEIE